MPRSPVRLVFLAGVLAVGLWRPVVAQTGPGTACTTPNDPACNHLKCYQIKDKPSTIVSKTPVVQVDNQFGREVLFRLQPVLLCVPSLKSCCNATGCSPANCGANPVPAPALPHFKCYRIKAKTCPNADCTAKLASFSKGTFVNLRDQFGQETNVPVGNPVLLCAPALKEVIGLPTTTTTTTTTIQNTTTTSTTTTTTTLLCHMDPVTLACTGPCPPTAPAGAQCQKINGKCDCVLPPVCCECTGAAGAFCTNTNGACPSNCTTVPNGTCNAATAHCSCGLCRDPGVASCNTTIQCSTSKPCPAPLVCDPFNCPAPCDPCDQGPTCNPVSCLRADGTISACHVPGPGATCNCCGPTGAFCTSDFDCCSFICNGGICS